MNQVFDWIVFGLVCVFYFGRGKEGDYIRSGRLGGAGYSTLVGFNMGVTQVG
jgi:hypothetical protein